MLTPKQWVATAAAFAVGYALPYLLVSYVLWEWQDFGDGFRLTCLLFGGFAAWAVGSYYFMVVNYK